MISCIQNYGRYRARYLDGWCLHIILHWLGKGGVNLQQVNEKLKNWKKDQIIMVERKDYE